MSHAPAQASWISFAVSAVVILVVLGLRMRRMRRERPLRIERLWIIPAIYLCVAGYMFWRAPPAGTIWAVCIVGLVAGAALGWQRGRLMRITVDPATHALSQRASPWAMLFILALILVRTAVRQAAMMGGARFHVDVTAVTDVLIAFALGLLAAQRLEMYLRARRLLDEARAA